MQQYFDLFLARVRKECVDHFVQIDIDKKIYILIILKTFLKTSPKRSYKIDYRIQKKQNIPIDDDICGGSTWYFNKAFLNT